MKFFNLNCENARFHFRCEFASSFTKSLIFAATIVIFKFLYEYLNFLELKLFFKINNVVLDS